jgi:hypothetical protein
MQIATMGKIIPVIRSEFFIGHVLGGQDFDFDISLLITKHGVLVESDIDLGMRSVGAVDFATVSGILDGDDVAPAINRITGMFGEVESLKKPLAS